MHNVHKINPKPLDLTVQRSRKGALKQGHHIPMALPTIIDNGLLV